MTIDSSQSVMTRSTVTTVVPAADDYDDDVTYYLRRTNNNYTMDRTHYDSRAVLDRPTLAMASFATRRCQHVRRSRDYAIMIDKRRPDQLWIAARH